MTYKNSGISMKVFKNILKFVTALCISYFVGYIILYNILLLGRDLSQIPWKLHYLLFFLACGILGIVLRFRYKK